MTDSSSSESSDMTIMYNIVASLIFFFVTWLFIFPMNDLVPLDRRTVSVVGATLCFLTRAIFFRKDEMDVASSVDFDVLVLLGSIMVVNFILTNQREAIILVDKIQESIKSEPRKGFWYVSLASFVLSPLLTNDGVCLLMVEPVLAAFHPPEKMDTEHKLQVKNPSKARANGSMELSSADALYFMLTICSSANIGSALTYTGNPQNMLVAMESIEVMPPFMFLGYMLIPSVLAWFATIWQIERCWMKNRKKLEDEQYAIDEQLLSEDKKIGDQPESNDLLKLKIDCATEEDLEGLDERSQFASPLDPKHRVRKNLFDDNTWRIKSPAPYLLLILATLMVLGIFMNWLSIAAVVCTAACTMVTVAVVGTHWTGVPLIMGTNERGNGNRVLTLDERKKTIEIFFEEMFDSLDYNLLILFTGLFVVIENISSTGIPAKAWSALAGKTPFRSFGSVVGISAFVLFVSQSLGNVPVIQLARPNCADLADLDKRYAWAVLSYVATVGGNLTITGSAANIIVAEQAARLDKDERNHMNFWNHYEVCFWVTLASCIFGTVIITAVFQADVALMGYY